MVVTATRTARAIVDVPNTVDEIDRERMDELLVQDLKEGLAQWLTFQM